MSFLATNQRKVKSFTAFICLLSSLKKITPRVGNVHFWVSHLAPHRQVVILRVKNPDGDVAHCQLFGEYEAEADVAEGEAFKSTFKK